MFLCAPPFIRTSGVVAPPPPGGPYEFDITIGNAGSIYGYSVGFGIGSISAYDDIFSYIYNGFGTWYIGVKSDSPVIPQTGGSNYYSVYIESGASSTGVYLPNGIAPISFSSSVYSEQKNSAITINTSGTASFSIEFTPV